MKEDIIELVTKIQLKELDIEKDPVSYMGYSVDDVLDILSEIKKDLNKIISKK